MGEIARESRVRTTFSLPFSGLNFSGMESHVLRPMITALHLLTPSAVSARGGTRFVTRAKYPISFFNCGHGSVPPFPMPSEGVAARMRVRENGRDFEGGGIADGAVLVGAALVGVGGWAVDEEDIA